MHPPCELMMETFLPSIRALVSRRLNKEGLSQGRVASLLGITQASVSLYLSEKPSKPLDQLSELGISGEEAERYSSLLAEDLKRNPVYAVSTLYAIWSDLLGKGLMCRAHRKEYPFLANCDVCMKTFGSEEVKGFEAIEHVSRAVAMIESSEAFVRVMPQVSVNIAYVYGEATSVDDVVAVPGRLVKAHDKARAFMKPEFGASTHLAKVLLEVKSRMKSFNAAINLKYDRQIEKILRRTKLRILRIGGVYPQGVDDPVVESLRQKIRESRGEFDALVDTGGPGLEPNLYLFATDAVEAASLAIKVAKLY